MKLHPPVYAGVAMHYNEPWEGACSGLASVSRTAISIACIIVAFPTRFSSDTEETVLCYAESRDGITWTRPRIGLVEFKGSKDNNILFAWSPRDRGSTRITSRHFSTPGRGFRGRNGSRALARHHGMPTGGRSASYIRLLPGTGSTGRRSVLRQSFRWGASIPRIRRSGLRRNNVTCSFAANIWTRIQPTTWLNGRLWTIPRPRSRKRPGKLTTNGGTSMAFVQS